MMKNVIAAFVGFAAAIPAHALTHYEFNGTVAMQYEFGAGFVGGNKFQGDPFTLIFDIDYAKLNQVAFPGPVYQTSSSVPPDEHPHLSARFYLGNYEFDLGDRLGDGGVGFGQFQASAPLQPFDFLDPDATWQIAAYSGDKFGNNGLRMIAVLGNDPGSARGYGFAINDGHGNSSQFTFFFGTPIITRDVGDPPPPPPPPPLPSAVPESATWAMMLGGFGLLGATLRRQRKIAATSA